MIYLIILAAVRKGYNRSATCRILTCDSLVAGTTSLCLQTWCNDAVPCSILPRKPTRTTQIRKHYYKLTAVNRATVRRQFWILAGCTFSNIDLLNFYLLTLRATFKGSADQQILLSLNMIDNLFSQIYMTRPEGQTQVITRDQSISLSFAVCLGF